LETIMASSSVRARLQLGLDGGLDLVTGAHRHGGLVDHDAVALM
jgi:hypothetical protein